MNRLNPEEEETIDIHSVSAAEIGDVLALLFEHLNLVLVRPKYGCDPRNLELRRDFVTADEVKIRRSQT